MTNDKTGSAARTKLWDKVEWAYFRVAAIAFLAGGFAIINALNKSGNWNEYTVAATLAGAILVLGALGVEQLLKEVLGLAE